MKRTFYPADILLPNKQIEMYRWSVIACDQFTSEPEYWKETEKIVGDAPSTLRMILPEIYLEGPKEKEKLENIRYSMEKYLSNRIFEEYKDALIYVERTDSTGKIRAGIVGCVDLEQYDYHKGSTSWIRATEATVEERIPARIRVRRNAQLELPHIMLLLDDPNCTVIEPCERYKKEENVLYDFDVMQGGGHLKGYLLEKEEQESIFHALDVLQSHETGKPENGQSGMLLAVGDGNHSLASAKEYYEELKTIYPAEVYMHHPARYALTEIVNLHSPALEFEAIHRIVKEVQIAPFLQTMTEKLGLQVEQEYKLCASKLEEGYMPFPETQSDQKMDIVVGSHVYRVMLTKPSAKLTVGSLQKFLDEYQKKNPMKVDYIHGKETIFTLAMEENSVGFLLPDMRKEELFPTVISDGALPRKTFSMGHAVDKRYYTECRMIKEG